MEGCVLFAERINHHLMPGQPFLLTRSAAQINGRHPLKFRKFRKFLCLWKNVFKLRWQNNRCKCGVMQSILVEFPSCSNTKRCFCSSVRRTRTAREGLGWGKRTCPGRRSMYVCAWLAVKCWLGDGVKDCTVCPFTHNFGECWSKEGQEYIIFLQPEHQRPIKAP